ncbi:MAG: D-alanyl-D-alanine carboxypeptidase [Chitinophagales bacterium]|nr:D-alanyl-D-alanine carboxypeptidase [Chitinophagales bacterium]
MKSFLHLIFLQFFFSSVSLAQWQDAYESFVNKESFSSAYIGVSFVDLETGELIFEANGSRYFYPASVQKLLVTAAALQLLGGDYQYATNVYYTGTIQDNSLKGSLIIEASGDPSLNSTYVSYDFLKLLLLELEKAGIKKIEGSIIFNKQKNQHNTPATWLFEDIGNYYGVGAQIFNYKDNLYSINFRQKQNGQVPSIEKIDVAIPYKFSLQLECSDALKGDHAFIMGAPFSLEREIRGTIGSGTGIQVVKGANAHPDFSLEEDIKKSIDVLITSSDKANRKLLFSGQSSVLKSLVRLCNYESINLFAEAFLNTLGLEFKQRYETESGIEILKNFVNQLNLKSKELIIKDGSGLSRLNALSPNFASEWLYHFYKNEDFRSSLPVAGESGTLKYLNNPNIKGKILAKSGSAEGVVNYAGYLYADNSKKYAFSIFVNNAFASKSAIRREIGIYLEQLIKLKEE